MTLVGKLGSREPLPNYMPRTINLLPLLRLQSDLDRDLNIGLFRGSASVSMGKPLKATLENKDHDITVTQDRRNPMLQKVSYAPDNEMLKDFRSLKTLKHLYNEVMDLTAAVVPEVIMHKTFPIIPKPDLKNLCPALETSDALGYYETSTGSFYRMLKRRFSLTGTKNPSTIIKELMLANRIWHPSYGQKIKSTQKLQTIHGLEADGEHKGWMEILAMPKPNPVEGSIRFPPLMSELCDVFTKDRWWRDLGIPRRFLTLADGVTVDGVVYLLKKNRVSIPT